MEAVPPVGLVVFDVGGVLVEVISWESAHLACGYGPERLPPGETFLSKLRQLNGAYDRGALSPQEYEQSAASASAGRYSAADVRRIHAMQLQGEAPGVAAVFDALDRQGYDTALLSNTNPVHWTRLLSRADAVAAYPTLLRATLRVASFELRCAKPDPAIYGRFAQAAGLPADALLFFDDREANVAAARLSGWRAELIDPATDTAAQLLDHLRTHACLTG